MVWDAVAFPQAGTRVRYDGHADGRPEYGVVVHSWWNEEMGGVDCYVAFFGDVPPKDAPEIKPYVLRYPAEALAVLAD